MKRSLLLILSVPILAWSCIREAPTFCDTGQASDILSAAQNMFLLYEQPSTKAGTQYDTSILALPPGDINPFWNSSKAGRDFSDDIDDLKTELSATTSYYVMRDSSMVLPVWCELLYERDRNDGMEGIFFVYFLPSQPFAMKHGTRIKCGIDTVLDPELNYDGVVIYTTMSGLPVRIDDYDWGEISGSVYIPELDSQEKRERAAEFIANAMGGMTIYRADNIFATKTEQFVEEEQGGELKESICISDAVRNNQNMTTLLKLYDLLVGNESASLNIMPGPPGGGGGSCGSNNDGDKSADQGNSIKAFFRKISTKFKHKADSDEYLDVSQNTLEEYLMGLYEKADDHMKTIIEQLLSKLTNVKEIVIDDNYPKGAFEYGYCAYYDGICTIYINPNNVKRPFVLLEELFHAYQYQTTPNYGKGNMEMEAHIFCSILINSDKTRMRVYSPTYEDNYDNMYNYYLGNCSFSEANNDLYTKFGYDKQTYGADESVVSQFKHIKDLGL